MKNIKWLLLAVLVVFPMLTLTVKKTNSISFYLLLFTGIGALLFRSRITNKSIRLIPVEYWPLCLAMTTMAIAVLPYQLATGDYQFSPYDIPLRLACFAIFFQLFSLLTSGELKIVQWGIIGGVFVSLAVIFLQTHGGNIRPAKINFLGVIPFSNHATLLAFIALLSIRWQENSNRALSALKVLTLFAGLYINFLSQSRGGWLALLLYMIIGGVLFFTEHRKKTAFILLLVLSIVAGAALFSQNINNRIGDVKSDIASYVDGTNPDTSIGLRFQFWKSALVMIREHPLTGIGSDNYRQEMEKLVTRKIVTPLAATFPHCHNEILFQTVRYGLFGLISAIAVLFVPFYCFWKNVHHPDVQVQTTAWMGIVFCLAFFSFGLTDVVLVWRETVTFYVFFIAVFLSLLAKQRQEWESARIEL